MIDHFKRSWLPLKKLDEFLQLEPALIILGAALVSWLVYRIFLRSVSEDRHQLIKKNFRNLVVHLGGALWVLAFYKMLLALQDVEWAIFGAGYIGCIALFWGAYIVVKIFRIFPIEWLFYSHMREGVPVLLFNLFTLIFSCFLFVIILTQVFGLRLAPLLATSAFFSVVLGLALQETLGNLFAGLSLQFDKPYDIGDWIEVSVSNQKWVGVVQEVTWRATTLIGFTEELITIPNRQMAQAETANFSKRDKPFIRSQIFRIPFEISVEDGRNVILSAAQTVTGILKVPAPLVLIWEITDSWIAIKLIYYIKDYGAQFIISDEVLRKVGAELKSHGVPLASQRFFVFQPDQRKT